MSDLAEMFSELDLLEAPEMRSDVDARIAAGRSPGDEVALPDVTVAWWRGPLIAVGTALAILIAIGAVVLLIRGENASVGPARQVTTTPATAPSPPLTAETTAEPLEPVAVPIGEVQGLARSGDTLWAWDATGQIADYHEGAWSRLPSLPNPAVDVTGSNDGDVWAITTNPCDPPAEDPVVECEETALWQLEGSRWRQAPEWRLLPDDLEDIEVDAVTGAVWLVGAEGVLHRWDGTDMTVAVDSTQMYNDGIAVTRDGAVWLSRFNPWFPNTVGLARYNDVAGTWEPIHPFGDENRHAVMASTPNGDLWVWLSEAPPTLPSSGKALAYYDSGTGEWTTYVDGIPEASRAMTADDDGVWLPTADETGIWQFDGETWTRYPANTGSRSDVLDIAAVDGSIWFIHDRDPALYQVEP